MSPVRTSGSSRDAYMERHSGQDIVPPSVCTCGETFVRPDVGANDFPNTGTGPRADIHWIDICIAATSRRPICARGIVQVFFVPRQIGSCLETGTFLLPPKPMTPMSVSVGLHVPINSEVVSVFQSAVDLHIRARTPRDTHFTNTECNKLQDFRMAAILHAFNGQVDITQAFNWTWQRILAEFVNIQNNLDGYGVIADAATRASFPHVVQQITDMCHQSEVFPPAAGPPTLRVHYQGTDFELETLFDLVGWIFSVTGTTPAGATVDNYFYPLAVLYAKFCRVLSSSQKQPQVLQMTWFTQAGVGRVSLGAVLDRPPAALKESARVRRANRLVAENMATDIHECHIAGATPQIVGHCAETFPFLFVQSIHAQVDLHNARGLSARPYKIIDPSRGPDMFVVPVPGVRNQFLLDRCPNCLQIINRMGMDQAKFMMNQL
ncbi:uncharacterized protein FIBRA_03735 [Fibroporia radiculosa]|uniref:Uncharacterized protein n=1 Tax=Fibroporia radiculosa TaxID=599839 RepID=J4HW55_9APHY|nr:uncharacterized protein FIBRA_03735 [Fibroporia radiculosa]CCM01672.1 predicted protein [Fibroporia radiculosa]